MTIFLLRLLFLLTVFRPVLGTYCTGHDGCQDQSIVDSALTCSGGERCCKNVRFTCSDPTTCVVNVNGGGHDQLQNSKLFAQDTNHFQLNCDATGTRECQDTHVFCPTKPGSTCTCKGSCPNSLKLYCPEEVTCTGGTIIHTNTYYCDGGGANVYCRNSSHAISLCDSSVPDEHCVSIVVDGTYYSIRCGDGHVYERPRCPTYYQGKYDHVRYINVTVTEYEDAALPLESLCKNSIPPKHQLVKSSNRAFQIKSWNAGCEKRKSKLNKCKSACNNPQGCCGTTCASNSCSGGGCCDASKNICKEACKFMFAPQVYNVINETQYVNQTRYIDTPKYINKTNYINKTRYINHTIYTNRYNYVNRYINRYVNRYVNRYINKTRYTTNHTTNHTTSGTETYIIMLAGAAVLISLLIFCHLLWCRTWCIQKKKEHNKHEHAITIELENIEETTPSPVRHRRVHI